MADPATPNAVVAMRLKGNAATAVHWEPVLRDVSNALLGSPVTKYELWYTPRSNLLDWQLLKTVNTTDLAGAVDTTALHVGLIPTIPYWYKVKAFVGAAESTFSTIVTDFDS